MTGDFRLRGHGMVEPWNPIRFTFDGRQYQGCKGDTLASALLANGVHLVGRSFKYHRPRGILSAGAEEPNALVRVIRDRGRETPNLRATQVEIYDGLRAESQNRWPSLRHDFAAVADLAAPLLPAGFYYKTFMPSLAAWRDWFEPLIRRAAGLGRVPPTEDADRYANRFAHCDVLVVGGGPAGLAAAREAAASGAWVILCDEQPRLGGTLRAEPEARVEGMAARDWVDAAISELAAIARVTLLPRTQAFGYFADNFLALAERCTDHLATPQAGRPRERLWQVRAREVVLATGAIERPLVFPGNDRPGVMLAGAALDYLLRYGVAVGRQVAVVTAHDSAYRAALALHGAGVSVPVIADLRTGEPNAWAVRVRAAGIRVEAGAVPVGSDGRLRVHGVRLRLLDGTAESVSCDTLLMSGGWTPSVHLFSQSRGRLRFDAALECHVPDVSVQQERSAGACRGVFNLADVLADGARAGAEAAREAGRTSRVIAPLGVTGAQEMRGGPVSPIPAKGRAFIDFQNDVTAKDIALAAREGYRSVEHAKRYTTAGMATDQGKLGNVNMIAALAQATAQAPADVGLTTYRAPYTPVTFGTLAGMARDALFDPVRTTPLHDAATAAGAVFEDVGAWKRAWYLPRGGEDRHAAVARECAMVRSSVGVFDASTLGKIDVSGPDAAEFLDRIYATTLKNLPVGKCRYALMLTEAGFVMDDGIVARLGDGRFHVTTTTGGAARVLAHMEDYRQTEWPDLRVWLTSTTEQWAVIAVQGPRARDVLTPLVRDIDLAMLPFMAVRDGRLLDAPLRLFRVSFTGELGYEVNVPANRARAIFDVIMDRAQEFGGALYGTEAMHVLRAEKGFVIVGQETDGTVSLDDLGFGVMGRSKRDFVGKRSLSLPDMRAPGRLQLVGLLPERILEEGAQITSVANPPPGTRALGHVTSAYHSPALGRPIALALLADGRARHGETLFVPMPGGAIPVRVVPPVFVDPEAGRVHG